MVVGYFRLLWSSFQKNSLSTSFAYFKSNLNMLIGLKAIQENSAQGSVCEFTGQCDTENENDLLCIKEHQCHLKQKYIPQLFFKCVADFFNFRTYSDRNVKRRKFKKRANPSRKAALILHGNFCPIPTTYCCITPWCETEWKDNKAWNEKAIFYGIVFSVLIFVDLWWQDLVIIMTLGNKVRQKTAEVRGTVWHELKYDLAEISRYIAKGSGPSGMCRWIGAQLRDDPR